MFNVMGVSAFFHDSMLSSPGWVVDCRHSGGTVVSAEARPSSAETRISDVPRRGWLDDRGYRLRGVLRAALDQTGTATLAGVASHLSDALRTAMAEVASTGSVAQGCLGLR